MKPKSPIRLAFPLASAIAALLTATSLHAATFYWDQNGTTGGFGTGTGAWAQNDTNPGPGRWTTDATGALAGSVTQVTANTDAFNFGPATLGLAAGTITVNAAGVTMGSTTYGAASGAIVLTGGTITYSAAPTITVNNTTNRIGSIIGGAATSFTKAGSGVLVLNGANTYTGSTIINAGTIDLGGGTATGSLASTVLTLGGGSLNFTRTGTNTQNFTTTSITGASIITGAAGNTLNLGTVSRGTGNRFYDFGTTGLGTVAALAASNVNGIMPGFTVSDSWAVANGSGVAISGLSSYTLTSVAGTAGAGYSNGNIDVDNSAGLLDAAITANSLRFSTAAANTLTLATGTNTISSGGILVGSGVGANLSTITGDTLTGAVSKDLAIIQNNTSGGLTISSVIANNTSTSITKSGAGLLTLSGNNTFTGGVTINAGNVVIGNAGALNSTAGSQNAVAFGAGSTGTLSLTGSSVVISNLSTNAATPGTTFVQNANGSSVPNATLTVGNASNLSGTFAGVIQNGTGGGTLALTKAGTGTLTLSGANTYSGDTTLTAGVVAISNATSFGTSNVLVTASSRINAIGGITYANAIDVGTGVTLTMQNPATTTSTATFTGVLSGAGSLSLANSGTNGQQGILAFTNTANTFTGNVVLSASGSGDEHFQFNSIGDAGNFTFAKNGNRQLITHTGSSNITFATRAINIASTMTNITTRQGMDGGGGNPVSSFFSSGAGVLTFNANMGMTSLASDGVFYFNGTNTGNNTFAGTIGDPTGAGKLWIGKLGAGTWFLTGDNTYEGGTIVANGILSVSKIENAANAQPLGVGTIIQFGVGNNGTSGNLVFTGSTVSTTDKQVVIGPMNQANGLGTGGIINNGSGSLTFSNAAFNPTISGNVVSGVTTNAVTVARTLTLGGTNTGINKISGIIQNNNGATGTVAITKADAGTWELAGNNSYTGATTLSGGTLILSGANTTTGATAVPAGTLVLANPLAVQTSSGITLGGASAATLRLATDAALTLPQIVGSTGAGGTTFVSDRATSGAGLTHALGTSTLGANTFNFTSGANVTSGTAGISFAAVNMTSGSAGTTLLNPTTAVVTIVGGVTSATNNFARTLELGGTGIGHSIGGVITQSVASALSLTKSNSSTWTLTGANTYSGPTTVSAGTLALGANNVLPDTSAVSIANATLDASANTTADTAGTLDPTAAAVINIGSGGALAFADSSGVDWSGGTLNITGTLGATSIRFGSTSGGLTAGQLAVISVNGAGAGTYALDSNGYLISSGAPEIAVDQGGNINSGGSKTFTTTTIGSNTSLTFTINNTGSTALNLTGSPDLVAVTGANASEFTVTSVPSSPVGAGGSTTFTVQFAPTGSGTRNALLTIANNDSDEGSFTINVSGTGQTPYEAWSGGAAFDVDTNGDGVKNGLAFLLGASGPGVSALSLLPTVSESSGNLTMTFNMLNSTARGTASLKLLHSSDVGVSDPWTSVAVTDANSGPTSGVTFTVTPGSPTNAVSATISSSEAAGGKLFGRLEANTP